MAGLMDKPFNLIDQTNLFKINYYKKSSNMYNSENVLAGRIRKRYDFTGRQRFVSTPMSFSGGVGSGVLPEANAAIYQGAIITAKKVYATCMIDREAIKASVNNQGAFVQATKETVQKTVESYMRNNSRILFSDGSGVLAQGGVTGAANVTGAGSTGSPYVVSFGGTPTGPTKYQWLLSNFEEKDYVQVVTGFAPVTGGPPTGSPEGSNADTNLLEIVSVDEVNKTVSLVGTSTRLAALAGTGAFSATDALVMQRSFNNDPIGLMGIFDASANNTGTLYNINVQRRWKMFTQDAAGAGVTTDLMNGVMLSQEKRFGKVPNMIMTSYNQFQKILALLEDQKRYPLPNRNLKGALSFMGIEFMSTRGPVGIFVDRFGQDDRIWFLNDDFIEVHHRPGFGWFDDDGTVFLRDATSDSYGARYGGYFDNFIVPTAHACLYNLA